MQGHLKTDYFLDVFLSGKRRTEIEPIPRLSQSLEARVSVASGGAGGWAAAPEAAIGVELKNERGYAQYGGEFREMGVMLREMERKRWK